MHVTFTLSQAFLDHAGSCNFKKMIDDIAVYLSKKSKFTNVQRDHLMDFQRMRK